MIRTFKPRIGQTMKTVAILSEKGGAGKTPHAVHLATAAQLAGIPTGQPPG